MLRGDVCKVKAMSAMGTHRCPAFASFDAKTRYRSLETVGFNGRRCRSRSSPILTVNAQILLDPLHTVSHILWSSAPRTLTQCNHCALPIGAAVTEAVAEASGGYGTMTLRYTLMPIITLAQNVFSTL